jgi:hypothetical protein
MGHETADSILAHLARAKAQRGAKVSAEELARLEHQAARLPMPRVLP